MRATAAIGFSAYQVKRSMLGWLARRQSRSRAKSCRPCAPTPGPGGSGEAIVRATAATENPCGLTRWDMKQVAPTSGRALAQPTLDAAACPCADRTKL